MKKLKLLLLALFTPSFFLFGQTIKRDTVYSPEVLKKMEKERIKDSILRIQDSVYFINNNGKNNSYKIKGNLLGVFIHDFRKLNNNDFSIELLYEKEDSTYKLYLEVKVQIASSYRTKEEESLENLSLFLISNENGIEKKISINFIQAESITTEIKIDSNKFTARYDLESIPKDKLELLKTLEIRYLSFKSEKHKNLYDSDWIGHNYVNIGTIHKRYFIQAFKSLEEIK